MMHAIRIHAYGGPEVMELEELATPIPGIGQAVIRVHAASGDFLDVQKRRGELVGQSFYHRGSPAGADLPATLGTQGGGMVEVLGAQVSKGRAGDQISFAGESCASHAVGPAARLIRIPAGI